MEQVLWYLNSAWLTPQVNQRLLSLYKTYNLRPPKPMLLSRAVFWVTHQLPFHSQELGCSPLFEKPIFIHTSGFSTLLLQSKCSGWDLPSRALKVSANSRALGGPGTLDRITLGKPSALCSHTCFLGCGLAGPKTECATTPFLVLMLQGAASRMTAKTAT